MSDDIFSGSDQLISKLKGELAGEKAQSSLLASENHVLRTRLYEQNCMADKTLESINRVEEKISGLLDEKNRLELSLKGAKHETSVLREERDSLEGERKNLRICNDNLIADLEKERALLRECMERNRVLLRNIYCNERDEVLTSLNKQLACNVENHNQQVVRNIELVSLNEKLTDLCWVTKPESSKVG